MRDITATEAARNFSDVLDAVEHRNQTFVVVRDGHPVARIAPASGATGKAVKDILRTHSRDKAWSAELLLMRDSLTLEEIPLERLIFDTSVLVSRTKSAPFGRARQQ